MEDIFHHIVAEILEFMRLTIAFFYQLQPLRMMSAMA
jgi:hypothetical protein